MEPKETTEVHAAAVPVIVLLAGAGVAAAVDGALAARLGVLVVVTKHVVVAVLLTVSL